MLDKEQELRDLRWHTKGLLYRIEELEAQVRELQGKKPERWEKEQELRVLRCHTQGLLCRIEELEAQVQALQGKKPKERWEDVTGACVLTGEENGATHITHENEVIFAHTGNGYRLRKVNALGYRPYRQQVEEPTKWALIVEREVS